MLGAAVAVSGAGPGAVMAVEERAGEAWRGAKGEHQLTRVGGVRNDDPKIGAGSGVCHVPSSPLINTTASADLLQRKHGVGSRDLPSFEGSRAHHRTRVRLLLVLRLLLLLLLVHRLRLVLLLRIHRLLPLLVWCWLTRLEDRLLSLLLLLLRICAWICHVRWCRGLINTCGHVPKRQIANNEEQRVHGREDGSSNTLQSQEHERSSTGHCHDTPQTTVPWPQ